MLRSEALRCCASALLRQTHLRTFAAGSCSAQLACCPPESPAPTCHHQPASAPACSTPLPRRADFRAFRGFSSSGSDHAPAAPALAAGGTASAAAGAAAEEQSVSPQSLHHPARQRNMAMVFTCVKCDTRSVKSFSRHSYEQGIVIVRCPGCQRLHLIADHMGWFGDNFKIEDLLAARGERVARGHEAGQQEQQGASGGGVLAWQDLAGWSRVQQVLGALHGGTEDADGAAAASGRQGSRGSGAAAAASRAAGSSGDGLAHAGTPPGSKPDVEEYVSSSGVLEAGPEDVDRWAAVRLARQQKQQQAPPTEPPADDARPSR